ncbi:CBS domain-containing protein [Amycolatopsis cynarae]|uniref:CBS domain-containing protein n=1 Tax=Amycolatopsis cynarae TaxID=2995223 RepID=A0ABY7ATJ9_9PSEU|nr:CBS domain-containing protein [Amycolatopsis sp. HUAS 11-8]WAL63289.1 CBS domain-containing protein [Amycolatopsis sp. HUAS 11-8]
MDGLLVADLMTHPVVTVSPMTPFKHLVAVLAEYRIGSVPVIDSYGRPIGVVSETDLLAKEEQRGVLKPPSLLASGRRWRHWDKARGTTADDVMTREVQTIRRDESVSAAARRLVDDDVRRLYVVDGSGRLVGVLARRDVLHVFLRDDDELRAEIERAVWRCVGDEPDQEPARVNVRVVDGEVTLTGKVRRRSQARRAAEVVEAIPGVVAVYNEFRFAEDDVVAG